MFSFTFGSLSAINVPLVSLSTIRFVTISQVDQYRNLDYDKLVYYVASQDPQDIQIAKSILLLMSPYMPNGIQFISFPSIEDIDDYLLSYETDNVVGGGYIFLIIIFEIGILFNKLDVERQHFDITIMYNTTEPFTQTAPQLNQILSKAIQRLYRYQTPIENVFLKEETLADLAESTFVQLAPILLTFSLSFLITVYVQLIVVEKEKDLKHQLFLVCYQNGYTY